jgi:hypothetical protein
MSPSTSVARERPRVTRKVPTPMPTRVAVRLRYQYPMVKPVEPVGVSVVTST